jgi:hypothetical protein
MKKAARKAIEYTKKEVQKIGTESFSTKKWRRATRHRRKKWLRSWTGDGPKGHGKKKNVNKVKWY